jgi:hypothetical protein
VEPRKDTWDPGALELRTVFRGVTFTVARALYPRDSEHPVVAEGIARRNCRDKYSETLGSEIAEGRALAALRRKLERKGPIHKVLMG